MIQNILDEDDNSANDSLESDNSTNNNSTNDSSSTDNSTERGEVCHSNIVAICQTKPEIVTVTEQRQMCNSSSNPKRSERLIPNESTVKVGYNELGYNHLGYIEQIK